MANKQINKQIPKYTNTDIHSRICNFINRVLNLVRYIPKTLENQIIAEQLIRSVTSVGANDQEADACQSKKDFLAKYAIAKKEIQETNYWLRLIYDRNINLQKRMIDLKKEGHEILLIVSKIIINTKVPKNS